MYTQDVDGNHYRVRRPSQNSYQGQNSYQDEARRKSTTTLDSRLSIGEGVQNFGSKVNGLLSNVHWFIFDLCLDRGALHLVRLCARWPALFVSVQLTILFTFVIIGLVATPVEIDADFESFLSTDVKSSLIKNAYDAAHDARPKPGIAKLRRLNESSAPTTGIYRVKDFSIYYEVQGKYSDIFATKVLNHIARIETSLASQHHWQELCGFTIEADRILCTSGVSFPSFVLPKLVKSGGSVIPTSLDYSEVGDDPIPIRSALVNARGHGVDDHKGIDQVFLPEDLLDTFQKDAYPTSSIRLRSVFRFKIPVGGTGLSKADADSRWEEVVKKTIIPYFDDNAESWEEDLLISYEGTDIADILLKDTLTGDMLWALASAAFVMCYLLFHTRSGLLTFTALLIALLACPFGYIFSAAVTQTRTVNFTSFLAVFLLVGFGADVIFVYTDFWHESINQSKDMGDRLIWTYRRAGRASFATTGVTCVSFFANLASVIRALRQFGFFMGLCVMLAWVFISTIYAPMLVLDERSCYYCRFFSKGAGKRRRACMERLTLHIRKWRALYLVFGLALTASVFPAVLKFELNTGLPDLYPEHHNVIVAEGATDKFIQISKTPMSALAFSASAEVSVCKETNPADQATCELRWCEVSQGETEIPAGKCACYPSTPTEPSECGLADFAEVTAMVISRSQLNHNDWKRIPALMQKMQQNGLLYKSQTSTDLPPMIMNEWESGRKISEHLATYVWKPERLNKATSSCGWREYCYCETQVCDTESTLQRTALFDVSVAVAPGDAPANVVRRLEETENAELRELQAGTTTAAPEPGAIVTQATIVSSKQIIIRVVFGIWANTNLLILGERKPEDMWAYKHGFNLASIWTQRNLLEFCRSVSSDPSLLVVRKFCWIEEFRNWLVQEGFKFPVSPPELFHQKGLEFIASRGAFYNNPSKGYEKVWVVNNQIIAAQADFALNVAKEGDKAKIEEIKIHWENRLESYNENEAKEEARGALLASKEFVKIDADNMLVISAAITFGVLLVLAFLGMVLFTCSVMLSLVVVLASVVIICALMAFIIVVLQWEIGLLEVIATIYFIGYAVTYSLHIAHKYAYSEGAEEPHDSRSNGHSSYTPSPRALSKSERRFRRTRFAMMSIGGAALGSSITTAGASFFLIFSTLGVFTKLGTMCLTVTVLSIIVALFPLPALLCSCGPVNPGRGCSACCRRNDYPKPHATSRPEMTTAPRPPVSNPNLPRHFSL